MTLSRRTFLTRSAGVALSVYGANAYGLRALRDGIAEAQAAGPPGAVLLSVYLAGGADGLSLLAPTGDARYAALRPTLALAPDAGTAFAEDPRLRWHPSAAGLATLHGEGKVSAMPAIGYVMPNQSHFTSRHYWEIGETVPGQADGWLGRLIDRIGTATNPLQGISLDGSLSPMLETASLPVAAVSRPEQYGLSSTSVTDQVLAGMLGTFGTFGTGGVPTPDYATAQAVLAEANTAGVRTALAPYSGTKTVSPVAYPANDQFAQRLATLARLLADGLPIRAVTTTASGGWDTHSGQADTFTANLKRLSEGLLAFQRDLEARGLADRVLVHVWTEFGRRPQENGSRGTDHGAGGVSLLIGLRVAGRMVGEFPGLDASQLDSRGNLAATADFRGVYCSILEGWYGIGADEMLIPGAASLPRYPILRA